MCVCVVSLTQKKSTIVGPVPRNAGGTFINYVQIVRWTAQGAMGACLVDVSCDEGDDLCREFLLHRLHGKCLLGDGARQSSADFDSHAQAVVTHALQRETCIAGSSIKAGKAKGELGGRQAGYSAQIRILI